MKRSKIVSAESEFFSHGKKISSLSVKIEQNLIFCYILIDLNLIEILLQLAV